MLKSLYIQNYRCLDSLRIHQLKRVNLITGKNNTGKSSILEAMAIYASRGDRSVLFQILEDHGEYVPKSVDEYDKVDAFKLMSSFFTNRNIRYLENDTIIIGDIDYGEIAKHNDTLFIDNGISFRFIQYRRGENMSIREISDENDLNNPIERGVRVMYDTAFDFLELDFNLFKNSSQYSFDRFKDSQYVKTSDVARDENGVLFDKIALTDNEKYVIEALQIIEPKIERIAFIQDNPLAKLRVSKVKLKDSIGTVPLRSMGDGINRILTIILALINSKDGYLMIDEFENGLHHSVQAKLWEIIIKLSKELNVQVFVTTHSNDTIRSVRNALSEMSEEDRNDVSTIKLMRTHEDKLEALLYDYEQLDYVIEQDIEIR
ncbi:MAG: ATP-binding protein [Proteiniphilum sp.]|nr:ATP-binding protein [Proteiniphilum sp.]